MTTKTNHTSQSHPTTNSGLPRSQKPFTYRSAYSPKSRLQVQFTPPGRTKQSFKDECDINIIMGRYMKTGQLDHVNQSLPQFSNLEGIDYQESMFIVAQSRTLFEQLPSGIRARFGNDPGAFLDFVHDPQNKTEMATMGLLTPEAATLVFQATPTAPPPAASQPTPPAANPQTPPAST